MKKNFSAPMLKWSIAVLGVLAVTVLVLQSANISKALMGQTQGLGSAYSGGFKVRQPAAVNNGLLRWWDFDGNLTDHISPDTATVNNMTATYPTGKFGSSLAFDGVDDYLSFSSTGLPTGTAPVSASIWVYPTALPASSGDYATAFRYGTTLKRNTLIFFNNAGTQQVCAHSGATSLCYNYTLTLNQWSHVVTVSDGANVTIYVNGVSLGTGALVIDVVLTSSVQAIGAVNNSAAFFAGNLDDFRLFNRTLTAGEVTSLYQGSTPAGCDQTCVGWWKMDEGTGSTVTDSSGQGLTATLGATTASPTWSMGVFQNSLKFDGVNDQLTVSDNDLLDVMSYDKTWSFWFNNSAPSTQQYLYRKSGSSNAGGIIIQLTATGLVRVDMRTNDGSQSLNLSPTSAVGADGKWHHVVVTLNRTTDLVAMYLDGVAQGTVSAAILHSDVPNSTSAAYIGGGNGNNSSAYLDDFRIYNRALADYEITAQYVAGR